MEKKYDIFISYSRKDIDIVRPIINELEARDFKIWLDLSNIDYGDTYPDKIAEALDESHSLLFMCTQNSLSAPYCKKEILYARTNGKMIRAILVDGQMPKQGWFALDYQDVNCINITKEEQKRKFFEDIEAVYQPDKAEERRRKIEEAKATARRKVQEEEKKRIQEAAKKAIEEEQAKLRRKEEERIRKTAETKTDNQQEEDKQLQLPKYIDAITELASMVVGDDEKETRKKNIRFERGGIFFLITSQINKTCEVTNNGNKNIWGDIKGKSYQGEVVIPSTVIHDSVEYTVSAIGKEAFYDSRELTAVIIPPTITRICAESFYGCWHLKHLTITKNILSIGSRAFTFSGLETIDVDPNNQNYASQNGVLFNKDFTELIYFPRNRKGRYEIPFETTKIHKDAFFSNIEELLISKQISDINLSYCDCLKHIDVDEENIHFASFDGILYNKSFKRLIKYPPKKNVNKLTLHENTCIIGENAFTFCHSLKDIVIPPSVTRIESCAFEYCDIISITLPPKLETIQDRAFYGCHKLESITNLSLLPQKISSDTFGKYSAVLHIRKGCKNKYGKTTWQKIVHPFETNYWDKFTIVDDLD